jgi:XTP/dITP diphosphohydrolase
MRIATPTDHFLQVNDTVVIATHNAGKLREISEMMSRAALKVLGASSFNLPEPEETGETFEANAVLKAEAGVVRVPPSHWILADDSGLEVDALDGAPSIYSARWAGENKDFNAAIQRIHDAITAKGIAPEGQRARFVCVLALARAEERTHTFHGIVEGKLTFPARGERGFGYDPIFIPDGYDITFAEMDAAEKHRISHRARAFELLMIEIAKKTPKRLSV